MFQDDSSQIRLLAVTLAEIIAALRALPDIDVYAIAASDDTASYLAADECHRRAEAYALNLEGMVAA